MSADDDRHPVDRLAEEFAERIRSGENPEIETYCETNPQFAEMIRAVFPSVQMVERASRREEHHQQADSGSSQSRLSGLPESLGDFQLIREIGHGGMGVVYEAMQKSLKRPVALKVISAMIAGSEKQLRRFRREAELAAGLHHSNIVPVFGFGEAQGLQYYAMQLIDGVTLAEVVHHLRRVRGTVTGLVEPAMTVVNSSRTGAADRGVSRPFCSGDAVLRLLGSMPTTEPPFVLQSELSLDSSSAFTEPRDPLAPTQIFSANGESASPDAVSAVQHPETMMDEDDDHLLPAEQVRLNQSWFQNIARLMTAVANAVDYAHRQGILHRDLKPANLILDRDGTIWVADFGLARPAQPEEITQTGEIVGTLRYMAPEQLRGQADQRTDVYSLGLTLYELLALKPAVEAPLLLTAAGRPPVAPLRLIRPEIPRDLETITLKACLSEPERRYQSARELAADLQRFLEDRPIHARRVTVAERLWRWSKRNPQIASLSAATLLLLLMIVVILGASYGRIQKSLNARNTEYARAEQNLQEKTAALVTVEHERLRAETNLDLAITAFEEVFANIAARGRSETLLDELSEDDLLPSADAMLSAADVTLLETLLGFFDRLAAENARDLSTKSADARRRVGDIQQQLGRLNDALVSYQTALTMYRAVAAGRSPEDPNLLLAQARILSQMILTVIKRGQLPAAIQQLSDLRDLLESSPALRDSTDGRFVLAGALNSLVSAGLRMGVDPRMRPRNPLFGRFLPNGEQPAPSPDQRLQREVKANAEAAAILQKLHAEDPNNESYRLALARTSRDKARLAQLQRDWNLADEAIATAIGILEKLQKEHPASDRFKYELANTLSTVTSFRPADMQRLVRSLQLCRELVEQHPANPEYGILLATTLARNAGLQLALGRIDRAETALKESLSLLEQLAAQFPDVLMYQFVLIRTQMQLAVFYSERKQPAPARELVESAIARAQSLSSGSQIRHPATMILNRLRDLRSRLSQE